ncbi:MAG TPA: TDP-N-acetylfucosamine:lipid II N-acetylfucosaminyltransferase [Clostridiales bacterium]|nr:TDP-N-acetylfucosamine:lipid II N-acetylfucosaminyltransferase [Clostridiales bacterium]HQP69019.1 TDP-N-acetylfucosamine:lipid II N-acetylfucosaminyltransferase [Clostridiales bacterium]
MILHIFNNSVYTGPFIEFVNRNFDQRDHIFFMAKSSVKHKLPDVTNLLNYSVSEKKLRNKIAVSLIKTGTYISLYFQCMKADKIIIHALFDTSIIKFFYLNKYFLKKSYWAIWGADLYDLKKSKDHKKNQKKERMKAAVIHKLKGVMGVPGDRKIAKEKYDCKAGEFDIMYVNVLRSDFLNVKKNISKAGISIQIGNSADPTNNHIEILENLAKFKDENITIYAPLSYGDLENASKVKAAGEKIFGSKFIAITEYMTPEKYSEYLSGIDILIFNHKRQQGLGNIYPMIYTGKKVFIREDTSSWDYFKNYLGIKMFNTLFLESL